ncbi:MAG: GntR family transcriptional regulator [Betaproteobacteria bacterium]|nr:MAG: GntR family transcriptional regulator [Betaproteobacteria bacterium]TMH65073.1 MAG: GntR family transcriptional regulator [Betaproteobacteria bacterium]
MPEHPPKPKTTSAARRGRKLLPARHHSDAAGYRVATASAAVYRILREQIVWLRRKPGEPIAEKDIAQAQGISRTPVREALLRLTAEGLVDTMPKSGTFVARIPLAALPEAIVVRKALEQVTARAAAMQARRSDVAGLRAILERQREADGAGDRIAFHQADEAFHAAIAAAGGYPGIWSLIQSVKTQIDRYRLLTLPQPGRMARVVKEHAAVVTAIERHDPERAAAAMAGHLDGLRISMEDIRRMNPDFFYEDIHSEEDLLA